MDLRNGIRGAIIAMVIVLLSGGYLVTMIPASSAVQVEAEVVSRTSRSGATGNTGVLICVLDNGRRVSIDIPPIATVQTGDSVILNSYDRYFISPKLSFAGKLINNQ